MNAEFNWWLLIVGLVIGAALTWLVMSESLRREVDVTESEQRGEARWIAALLSGAGRPVGSDRVEEILRLHREYLAAPPPDDTIEAVPAPAGRPDVVVQAPTPGTIGQAADDRREAVAPRQDDRVEHER